MRSAYAASGSSYFRFFPEAEGVAIGRGLRVAANDLDELQLTTSSRDSTVKLSREGQGIDLQS